MFEHECTQLQLIVDFPELSGDHDSFRILNAFPAFTCEVLLESFQNILREQCLTNLGVCLLQNMWCWAATSAKSSHT